MRDFNVVPSGRLNFDLSFYTRSDSLVKIAEILVSPHPVFQPDFLEQCRIRFCELVVD